MQIKKIGVTILVTIAIFGMAVPTQPVSAAKKVARVVKITKQTKRNYHVKQTNGYVYKLQGKKIKKQLTLKQVAKLTKYQQVTLTAQQQVVIKSAKGKNNNYLLVKKGNQILGYVLQSKLQIGKYQPTKVAVPTKKVPTKAPVKVSAKQTIVNVASQSDGQSPTTPATVNNATPAQAPETFQPQTSQNVSLQVNPFDNADAELSGSATAGASITVTIKNADYTIMAGATGDWVANLDTIIGGADSVVIVASKQGMNTVTLNSKIHYPEINYAINTQTPLNGSHFPKRTIKYFIATTDTKTQNAWQAGVDAWNNTKIIKFELVTDATEAELVLNSHWGAFTQIMDDATSGSVPEAVGITYRSSYSQTTGIYKGAVNALIRSDYLVESELSTSAWAQIAEHELGHALGLNHNVEHSLSVMDPSTYEDYNFNRNNPYAHEAIQAVDMVALHGIYDGLAW